MLKAYTDNGYGVIIDAYDGTAFVGDYADTNFLMKGLVSTNCDKGLDQRLLGFL